MPLITYTCHAVVKYNLDVTHMLNWNQEESSCRSRSQQGYFSLIGYLCLIGAWLSEDIGTNIMKTHMFERDWTAYLNIINHFTLKSEHDWEDLSVMLRNQ